MVRYGGATSGLPGSEVLDPSAFISRTPNRAFYTTGAVQGGSPAERPFGQVGKYGVNFGQIGTPDKIELGIDGLTDASKQPGVIPSFLGGIFGDIGYAVGDILDTPFDILGSIPAIGPNSYRQDSWDADIQKAFQQEADKNPLAGLFAISKASRVQWERDVERGVAPGPAILSDMLGPSTSIGNQIYNLFLGLGLPQRLVERTVAGASGREKAILEPSEEALKDPWVAEMYQRYQNGDFGQGQEARDRILDEMVLNGRGYTDNPWVAIGLSVITDPLILLSAGAGLGTAIARKGAGTLVSRLGNLPHVVEAAKAQLALDRGLAIDDAARIFDTDMVTRDAVLNKVATQFPDDVARIRADLTRIERFAVDVEPSMRPIKRIVDKINDPFSAIFGGGNAGRLTNSVLSHHATEGVLNAHDAFKSTAFLNGVRKSSPQMASVMEHSLGVYTANIARFQVRDWITAQFGRMTEFLVHSPDSVVASRLRGHGSNIARHVEEYARRVKPRYLPSGKGEAAEALAISEMREGTARRLSAMGMGDEEARALAATVDRDTAGLVDAIYFGYQIDKMLLAKGADEAAGALGSLTAENHARLSMAGPHELTKDRADALLAAIRAPQKDWDYIRRESRQYDALSNILPEGELDNGELIERLEKFLTDNADGFPTVITDPSALGPEMRRWAEDAEAIGYRPILAPADDVRWRPVEVPGKGGAKPTIRIAPWIGYTNEASSVKHYNDFQRWHNRMFGEIRGSRIVMEARRSFNLYAANRWGLTAEASERLFNKLIQAANDAGVTPRGLDAEQWFRVVMSSDLPKDVLQQMNKRDAVDGLLAAFEGKNWTVGFTQKVTGKAKRLTPESNALGRMAEAAYPLVRFQLNAFFQLQELIEAPFFNILYGIKPGWKMSEMDEVTAKVIDLLMTKGRWTYDDQIEYSRHVLAGATAARRGFGPQSKMGQMFYKFNVPVRRVKMVNYYRLTRKNLGREFKARVEEASPGAWARIRDHFGTSDEGEIAVRWFNERLHLTGFIDDGDWDGIQTLINMTKPNDLGAAALVEREGIAKVFGMTADQMTNGLRTGSLTPDIIRGGLEVLGADPAFIDNAIEIISFGSTADEFWNSMRAAMPSGRRGPVLAVREVWRARARALGISEEQLLARKMAGNVQSVQEAILRGLDEVELENYMFMAEAAQPGILRALAAKGEGDIQIGQIEGRPAYVREINGVKHVVVPGDNAGEFWSRGRIVTPEEYDALRARGEEVIAAPPAAPGAPIERLTPDDFQRAIYDQPDVDPIRTPRFKDGMEAFDKAGDPSALVPYADDIIEVGDRVFAGRRGPDRIEGYFDYESVKAGNREPERLARLAEALDDDYLMETIGIPEGTYLYHNTGYQTLEEIRNEGFMRPSKGGEAGSGARGPGYHRPVVWFSTDPKDAAGYNMNAMIRVKASSKYKFQSETSMMPTDVITSKRVAAEDIEFLGKDGQWHPLAQKPMGGSGSLNWYNETQSGFGVGEYFGYRVADPWSGLTVSLRDGAEPKGGIISSIASTVEVPVGSSDDVIGAAVDDFVRDHYDLLSRDGYYLGLFHNADKGTIDIDVNVVAYSTEDAEALQLYLGRNGGAYDTATGNGVYAPQLDPFPATGLEGNAVPRGSLKAADYDAMLPPRYIVDAAPDQAFAEPVEATHRLVTPDGEFDLFTPGGAKRLDDPDNAWTLWEEQLIFSQMINPRELLATPEGSVWMAKVFRGVWRAKESNFDTPESVINRFVFASLSPGMKIDFNQAAASRVRVTSQKHLDEVIAPMVDDITRAMRDAGMDINNPKEVGFVFQVKQGYWKNASATSLNEAQEKAVRTGITDKDRLKELGLSYKPGLKMGGTTEYYLSPESVSFRGKYTNAHWGTDIIWLRDFFLHEKPEVRNWFLKGAEESREDYAVRIAAVLPGLQLKAAYFGTDVGGPHLLDRAIIDTQIMGHHLETIFGKTDIPASWDEALKNPKFAALYDGRDDVGDWVYHGSRTQFQQSIKDFGVTRGDWTDHLPTASMSAGQGRSKIIYRARRETMVGGYEKAPGWYGGPRVGADDLQYSLDGGKSWKWVSDNSPIVGAAPEEIKAFYNGIFAKVQDKIRKGGKGTEDLWASMPNAEGKRLNIVGTINGADWRAQYAADPADALARAKVAVMERLAPEHPELARSLMSNDDILVAAMNTGNGGIVTYSGVYKYLDEIFDVERRQNIKALRQAAVAEGNKAYDEMADLMASWSRAEYQWFNWDLTRGIFNPESSMHGKADAVPALPHADLLKNIALGRVSGTGSIQGFVGGPQGRQLDQAQNALMFMEDQGRILGATKLEADGRRLMYLTEHADVRTLLHESFHIFASDLDPSGIRLVKHEFARAMNVPSTGGTILTRQEEEWVADLFHEYFRTGKASIPGMGDTLALFKGWLTETYGTILRRQASQTFASNVSGPAKVQAQEAVKQTRIALGKARSEANAAGNSYKSASNALRDRRAILRRQKKSGRQYDAVLTRRGYAQRDAKDRLVRAREEVRRLEKELRAKQRDYEKAKSLTPPPTHVPPATVGVRGTMTVEVKQFFDDLFAPAPVQKPPSLNQVLRNQGAYDVQEEAVWGAAQAAAIAAEEAAFRTHFYRRGRSWAERSANHPYLGLYPLSYMWGKVLPEMIRFLVKEPFGIPAPGAGLMASQNIYRQVLVQKEADPEFREFLAKNEPAFRSLSMLVPATPFDLPVNAPLIVRRIAEMGATNANRAPGKPSRTYGPEEIANIATDMTSYAFGPAQNFRTLMDFSTLFGGGAIDFGGAMFGEIENQLQGVLGGVEMPTPQGFIPTE